MPAPSAVHSTAAIAICQCAACLPQSNQSCAQSICDVLCLQIDSSRITPRVVQPVSDTTQAGTDSTLRQHSRTTSGAATGYTPRAMDTDAAATTPGNDPHSRISMGGILTARQQAVAANGNLGSQAMQAPALARLSDVSGGMRLGSDQIVAPGSHVLKLQAMNAAHVGLDSSTTAGHHASDLSYRGTGGGQLQSLEGAGLLPESWSDAVATVHQSEAGLAGRRAGKASLHPAQQLHVVAGAHGQVLGDGPVVMLAGGHGVGIPPKAALHEHTSTGSIMDRLLPRLRR